MLARGEGTVALAMLLPGHFNRLARFSKRGFGAAISPSSFAPHLAMQASIFASEGVST
jgi:hypothetical protein